MENTDVAAQGLSFTFDPVSGDLLANYVPNPGGPGLDSVMLREALRGQGYGEFHFVDKALDGFIVKAREAQAPLSLPIGKRLDAELKIVATDNLMTAFMTLTPAKGGKALLLEDILAALQQQGFTFGIVQEAIDGALAKGQCERLPIVQGVPSVPGSAARFENLLAEREKHLLEADENAVVLYRDLSHLLLVKQGDQLLRRIPPVQGHDGTNIKGQVVSAPSLPEIHFADKNPGAELDPQDENVLLAACSGQPVITRNGATVNSLLEVNNLDLSTGSVDFDGTIRVKGDVKAGMRLKASGDVIVLGIVEAAQISAGGNIAVKGGIIGRANSQAGAVGLPADTARIECGGTLQAMFTENARIKAADAIHVEFYARQCELFARNEIVVGKRGARNSHLAGGVAQATMRVKALNLGTPNGLKTLVQVGSDPYLAQELADKEALFKHKLAELDQVQKLIAHFKLNPQKAAGGVGEKIESTRKQIASAIFILIEEKNELLAKLSLTQEARVEVGEALFDGVEIRIGKQIGRVHETRGPCAVHLAEGVIVFEAVGGAGSARLGGGRTDEKK
ncbi:MAG: DUF342 domain-containing protein [Burkholderiaceae bacterium]|nr:DUF342 domain-containing protein [Burkholderiaceae bacterium]